MLTIVALKAFWATASKWGDSRHFFTLTHLTQSTSIDCLTCDVPTYRQSFLSRLPSTSFVDWFRAHNHPWHIRIAVEHIYLGHFAAHTVKHRAPFIINSYQNDIQLLIQLTTMKLPAAVSQFIISRCVRVCSLELHSNVSFSSTITSRASANHFMCT